MHLNVWNLFYKPIETLTVNDKLLKSRDFIFYFSYMSSSRELVLCSLEASYLARANWVTRDRHTLQFFDKLCAGNCCSQEEKCTKMNPYPWGVCDIKKCISSSLYIFYLRIAVKSEPHQMRHQHCVMLKSQLKVTEQRPCLRTNMAGIQTGFGYSK